MLLGLPVRAAHDVIFENRVTGDVALARAKSSPVFSYGRFTSDSASGALPPLVIYINMHRVWIMHEPYFQCRAFNPHSAPVYTPIWLALPCFHYSQFLGTQKRAKRLTGTDSVFPCVCGKYLFPLQGNWCCKVLSLIVVPTCYFFQGRMHPNVCTYKTAVTIRYFIYFIFKGCCKSCSIWITVSTREHMAIMRKQPLDLGGYPNYTWNKRAIWKHWWHS